MLTTTTTYQTKQYPQGGKPTVLGLGMSGVDGLDKV